MVRYKVHYDVFVEDASDEAEYEFTAQSEVECDSIEVVD